MATGCTKQLPAGYELSKDRRKKEKRYKPCGLACEPGQTVCPRHIMLAELAETTAADKAAQEQAAKLAQRQAGQRARA